MHAAKADDVAQRDTPAGNNPASAGQGTGEAGPTDEDGEGLEEGRQQEDCEGDEDALGVEFPVDEDVTEEDGGFEDAEEGPEISGQDDDWSEDDSPAAQAIDDGMTSW